MAQAVGNRETHEAPARGERLWRRYLPPPAGALGHTPHPPGHAIGSILSPCGLEKRPCVLATHELPRIPSESAIPLSCPTPEEHRRRRPAAVLVYTEYAKHILWKISRSSFAKCRTFPSRAFSFTTSPPCSRTGADSVRKSTRL